MGRIHDSSGLLRQVDHYGTAEESERKELDMRLRIWILGWVAVAFSLTALANTANPEGHDMTEPGTRHFEVLKALPLEAEAYQPAAAELIRQGVIERYGEEEWASIVLTHELHNHVGIMTVVGAKMAVRARELMHAPMRQVRILSETGPEPPFACAVDGMQAGLASTYAQQLIEAPETDTPTLAATFTLGNKSLHLALRPDYESRIRHFIHSATEAHGNLTPAYFEAIEDYCYEVWADFDRQVIFTETWLESTQPR